MRMITKHKDYYDSAIFEDRSGKLWIRYHEEVDDRRQTEIAKGLLTHPNTYLDFKIAKKHLQSLSEPVVYGDGSVSQFRDELREMQLSTESIIFCGRIYRCLLVEETWTYSRHQHRFWKDGQIEHVYELEMVKDKHRRIFGDVIKLKDVFKDQGAESERALNLCLEVQSPILSLEWSAPRKYPASWVLMKNTRLDRLSFFRMLPPQQAAQELSMFVDGVMTAPESPEPVSDKVKIQAHGMDERSFRKDPTKVHH